MLADEIFEVSRFVASATLKYAYNSISSVKVKVSGFSVLPSLQWSNTKPSIGLALLVRMLEPSVPTWGVA